MRAIANSADHLITMNVLQGHDSCAAVSPEDDWEGDLVAATGGARRKKKFLVSKQPQQQQQSGSGRRGDLPAMGPTRPPCPAPLCAFFMPSSASRLSTAMRDAYSRKTRGPGRDFGGAPQPTLLHHRQRFQPPLPGRYRVGFLHHAVGIATVRPTLTVANGRSIPCWGERSCTVTIAGGTFY
jgi:hypothetical protein